MAIPVLHHLSSPDLERGALPANPGSCAIAINAEIGLATGGADNFSFTVVTPDQTLTHDGYRWGRGYLIVHEFSWAEIERALAKLLLHADRESWRETAAVLAQNLHWEYDGYPEYVRR